MWDFDYNERTLFSHSSHRPLEHQGLHDLCSLSLCAACTPHGPNSDHGERLRSCRAPAGASVRALSPEVTLAELAAMLNLNALTWPLRRGGADEQNATPSSDP